MIGKTAHRLLPKGCTTGTRLQWSVGIRAEIWETALSMILALCQTGSIGMDGDDGY